MPLERPRHPELRVGNRLEIVAGLYPEDRGPLAMAALGRAFIGFLERDFASIAMGIPEQLIHLLADVAQAVPSGASRAAALAELARKLASRDADFRSRHPDLSEDHREFVADLRMLLADPDEAVALRARLEGAVGSDMYHDMVLGHVARSFPPATVPDALRSPRVPADLAALRQGRVSSAPAQQTFVRAAPTAGTWRPTPNHDRLAGLAGRRSTSGGVGRE